MSTSSGTSREILRLLGQGNSIDSICQRQGWTRDEFNSWWREETQRRLSPSSGKVPAGVNAPVRIERDRWGIPHVFADHAEDLFFGYGYALAQDRLFQLDYLRRKGAGRLAEILGPSGLEYDLLVRTVGLRRIAEDEWRTLPAETRSVLEAFSSGINAVLEAAADLPPIEFDLLDYRPEPWTPIDSLTIEVEFRWYLTGRFPVIVMPELAKRTLGTGPLFQAFLSREADDETMVPAGHYPKQQAGHEPIGPVWGRGGATQDTPSADSPPATATASPDDPTDPGAGIGSNNWVVAGRRSKTGLPLVASDPHIAFEAVSCWHEVHLCGGPYHVAGMAYVGMPAVMFGRTERVAWGCTNNICSQRDLYQERIAPENPGCFLYDGQWEPEHRLEELVAVRGQDAVPLTVRFSRNGPLVQDVLPEPARATGPVSLRWLGAHGGGWTTALLAMNRADSCSSLREAMRPWMVPTFSVVFGDVDGHIGYQMTGRVPIREVVERGYRPGWDPDHQWKGLIPFDAAPQLSDPDQAWVATANHRPAPDDFPYPLSGTWPDGLRARRLRQLLESDAAMSYEKFAAMQRDTCSVRAKALCPTMVALLQKLAPADSRFEVLAHHLEAWDGCYETDRVGATIFEVFFQKWCERVTAARFADDMAALQVNGIPSLAAKLLEVDPVGWFAPGIRKSTLETVAHQTLETLTTRLGPDVAQWTWGRVHTLPLRHVLSTRGDLGKLLDHGGTPAQGSATTVCNTAPSSDLSVRTGCTYRLIADLATSPPCLWAIDSQSQSGQVGSPHYSDQLGEWTDGKYHSLPLVKGLPEAQVAHRLQLG